ncbi:hypothetical protein B9Z19DRAFT_1128525 [Tuber borchii]|uniref:Uncharacterized protein n=1 Tax=Tuber borchii TaxID=42251 RepID=A0A2T6ZP63_TUBBO|nr:hypothetical protein B9Z19DRAFT_1128525 [Tuber borchii]
MVGISHCVTQHSGNPVGEILGHFSAINSASIQQERSYQAAIAPGDNKVAFFHGNPFKHNKSATSHHSNFVHDTAFLPEAHKNKKFLFPHSGPILLVCHPYPNALSPQQRAEAAWLDHPTANQDVLLMAPPSMAPTHILNGAKKGKVYFLLTGDLKTQGSVKILFYPTWAPPVTLEDPDIVFVSPGTVGYG